MIEFFGAEDGECGWSEINQNGNSTAYKFDAAGQRIAQTEPSGGIKTTTYNDTGWVLSEVNPQAKSMFYKYDQAGKQIATTDAVTDINTTTYDAAASLGSL